MSAAAVIYVDPKDDYQLEYLYFVESARTNAPDLTVIAFHPPEFAPPPRDNVELVPWQPLSSTDPLFKHHPFINSIACAVGQPAELWRPYTHLVRTDTDCFFLPGWATLPPPTTILNRPASYCFKPIVRERIQGICHDLGFTHQGHHNCGPTVYAPTEVVVKICAVALDASRLILQRFADGDYGDALDSPWPRGQWPGWYSGVTSMYACEAGINAAVAAGTRFEETYRLDANADSCEPLLHHFAHAHCYHNYMPFSKFAARRGDYSDGLRNSSTEPIGGARLNAQIPPHCFDIFQRAVQGTRFEHLAPKGY